MKLLDNITCQRCGYICTPVMAAQVALMLQQGVRASLPCGHRSYQCLTCEGLTDETKVGWHLPGAALCLTCFRDKKLMGSCAESRCKISRFKPGKQPAHLGSPFTLHELAGALYCESCYNARTATCAGCKRTGAELSPAYLQLLGTTWVCSSYGCMAKVANCAVCGTQAYDPPDWETAPRPHLGGSTARMCPTCWDVRGWCPHCEFNFTSRRPNGAPKRCNQCRPVLQYNDKAEQRLGFVGVPQGHKLQCADYKSKDFSAPCKCGWDRVFYGVELEVEGLHGEARDEAADNVVKLSGKRVICKRDGSLSDGGEAGFEIVTAPAPLTIQREIWRPIFDWFPHSGLKAQKTVTCGMHIHVSRAPLGGWLSVAKIIQFIHEPENRQFVEFMSGRPPGHYQDFMRDKRLYVPTAKPVQWSAPEGAPDGVRFLTHPDLGKRPLYSPRRDARSRYTAVNLQNPGTIEFRIFKATLNPHTFWARFEFVVALTKYCLPGVASIREMKVPYFAKWLSTQRKEYPDLCNHMVKGAFLAPLTDKPSTAAPVLAPAPRALTGKTKKGLRVKGTT